MSDLALIGAVAMVTAGLTIAIGSIVIPPAPLKKGENARSKPPFLRGAGGISTFAI